MYKTPAACVYDVLHKLPYLGNIMNAMCTKFVKVLGLMLLIQQIPAGEMDISLDLNLGKALPPPATESGVGDTMPDGELDRIVAVVDEDVITKAELEKNITQIMAQLRERNTSLPPRDSLALQVLERMISQRLQLQVAERLGLQIDDATLDRAVVNVAAKNNLSLSQLRSAVEHYGIGFNEFREDIRQQLLLLRLQTQEVVRRVNVSEQEVALFLRQASKQITDREAVRLQHILIATPDGANADVIKLAQNKIEELRQQLQTGADFAKMALVHSNGRQALEGGDLGWMPLSQVPTIAVDVASNLKPGAISIPIRDSSGFHIFKVVAVKGAGEQQIVNQTRARHILIKINEVISDQDAETRLMQLRIRLVGGEDFATLARSHSDDTASAIKGGELGWISPGNTVPEFEQQMGSLAVNELSQPFRSQFGWHLLQVLERRQHDNTQDALKMKAYENIRNRKVSEATDLWLRQLRGDAYVEVHLDRLPNHVN